MATDFSDVAKLAIDLRSAGAEARPFIRKAMQEISEEIRDEARGEAARTGLASYAASIGYTTEETASSIRGEVGPTPGRRQASFGFMEDGGSGVRSAPQHALRDAFNHNRDDAMERLKDAAQEGVDKAVGG